MLKKVIANANFLNLADKLIRTFLVNPTRGIVDKLVDNADNF